MLENKNFQTDIFSQFPKMLQTNSCKIVKNEPRILQKILPIILQKCTHKTSPSVQQGRTRSETNGNTLILNEKL